MDIQPLENPPTNFPILVDQGQHEITMEFIITKTSTPLFENSSIYMLSAMLLLLNLQTIHGLSKLFIDRFANKSSYVPQKELAHFPLITRLLLLYRCKNLVELLIWHKHGASTNGLI